MAGTVIDQRSVGSFLGRLQKLASPINLAEMDSVVQQAGRGTCNIIMIFQHLRTNIFIEQEPVFEERLVLPHIRPEPTRRRDTLVSVAI